MKYDIKNICCIGAGYVGGPTMAVIADRCPHIKVNVVDNNKERITNWNNDDLTKLPIYEPGLDEIIKRCRGVNLFFSDDVEKYIANADMIFISVNTPTKSKGLGAGQASDLRWIDASARQISKFAKNNTIVVEKSTLPVKTAKTIKKILESSNTKNPNDRTYLKKFTVLSNPEFLAEGSAINDLEKPDRILIGGQEIEAINALKGIYLNWVEEKKIITTNLWSSELSKLIANAFLAQRISAINSVSAICETTGANINEVSLAIGTDVRIGKYFLKSGPGFGGSCFKKDILNLVYICDHYGLKEVSSFWRRIVEINKWQQERISRIIIENLFGTITGKKICILGFSFKANTNDTRESPAIKICKDLLLEGSNLFIYDPRVNPNQISIDLNLMEGEKFGNEKYEGSWNFSREIYHCIEGADAIVIMTEWDEFKSLDWKKISQLMRTPSWVFDTRSIIESSALKKFGLNVWSVGVGDQV